MRTPALHPLSGRWSPRRSICSFRFVGNDYLFFAGYTVLQFIVLATAWNILGGYCGYVNFGSRRFFALGAYSASFSTPSASRSTTSCPDFLPAPLHAIFPLPVPVLIVVGGAVAGLVGLGMGYLTLRLRGVFFAIATLALAVVLQTLIVNWDFVGGSRGAYVIPPEKIPVFGPYIQYLFLLMLMLVIVALTTARADRALAARLRLRHHPRRRTGGGSLRRADAEAQADRHHRIRRAHGHGRRAVSVLHRLCRADSAFSLAYAVNSIAMPMIGGTTSGSARWSARCCSARCSRSPP